MTRCRLSAMSLALFLTISVASVPAFACFGSDVGAASTDVSAHLRWAEARDAAAVSSNLAGKINALNGCGGSDDQMRDAFADLSVFIARHVPRSECFNGDRGVGVTNRQAHRGWAGERSRADVVANLLWKTTAALACLDRPGQNRLFADMSVVIAKAAETNQAKAPTRVVWQLASVEIKDAAPSGTKALRIDDTQADAMGGLFRITALNDGECAPGQGVPGRPLEQRFLFRWRFDRDVTRVSHPEKVNVVLSIEADSTIPCFDLNPIVIVSTEGDRVLTAEPGGRFLFIPNPQAGHVGGPRVITVANPESGLERSSTAHSPMFKIYVWGFRGNRGMQLEARYIYTLAR